MSSDIKKMTEALKSGAAMLSEACPQCNSPLFKMPSNEIYCFKCNKKVIIVKTDEEAAKLSLPLGLTQLEETLKIKLRQLEQQIKAETDLEKLQSLMQLTLNGLMIIERIKKIKE